MAMVQDITINLSFDVAPAFYRWLDDIVLDFWWLEYLRMVRDAA